MTLAVAPGSLPWFNLLDVLKSSDPYAAVDGLRLEAPLWRSDFGVHVMTYDGCIELLRHQGFDQDAVTMLDAAGITDDEVRRQWTTSLLGAPRDAHDRMRRPVSPSFTPKAIAGLRGVVTELAETAAVAAVERGSLEVMGDLANRIPPAVFCRMIDAPMTDSPFIGRVSAEILEVFSRRPEVGPSIEASTHELMDYVDAFIARRRNDPLSDDLIWNLLAAEQDGERLSTEELRALVIEVLEASTDNTSSQLALVLHAASLDPTRWSALRDDPSTIPAFVEEASRLWPRIMSIAKICGDDADVAGVAVPARTPVFVMVPSAHRDPAHTSVPLDFDPARESRALNLNFGSGARYCIGAGLARLEICGAIEVLTRHWRSVTPLGEPDIDFNPGVVTVRSLSLAIEPA